MHKISPVRLASMVEPFGNKENKMNEFIQRVTKGDYEKSACLAFMISRLSSIDFLYFYEEENDKNIEIDLEDIERELAILLNVIFGQQNNNRKFRTKMNKFLCNIGIIDTVEYKKMFN